MGVAIKEQIRRALVEAYFDEVCNRLQDDFWPCLNEDNTSGGYFSCLLLVFTAIDATAGLVELSPRDFLRRYLGKINATYEALAVTLYTLFRHHVAHRGQPAHFTISVDKKRCAVAWLISKGEPFRYTQHLTLTKAADSLFSFSKGYKEVWNLQIVLERLYEDTVQAIKLLKEDVASSHALITKCARRIDSLFRPVDPEREKIPQAELDFIRELLSKNT